MVKPIPNTIASPNAYLLRKGILLNYVSCIKKPPAYHKGTCFLSINLRHMCLSCTRRYTFDNQYGSAMIQSLHRDIAYSTHGRQGYEGKFS